MPDEKKLANRREFLRDGARAVCFLAVGGTLGWVAASENKERSVWQIDPRKCTQCGKCATACVTTPSAVRCVHSYAICGYCDLCGGFQDPKRVAQNEAAENQLCPTGAIERKFTKEDPYYEYIIHEEKCIGCAKCVKGCGAYGNGSLYLQIKQERCVGCNECAIARACPARAISRVPASQPYHIRNKPGRE